jgi:hypothetical protein
VNSLTEREKSAPKSRKSSVVPSVEDGERTVLADQNIDESVTEKTELIKGEDGEDDDDTGTIIADVDAKSSRDSLVESLLSDDDVEMTG